MLKGGGGLTGTAKRNRLPVLSHTPNGAGLPEWPRFDRCIDYIWISESVQLRASGLFLNQPAKDDPELWPSDHVGVWADVEIG